MVNGRSVGSTAMLALFLNPGSCFPISSIGNRRTRTLLSERRNAADDSRRNAIIQIASLVSLPFPAAAGEVGARITKAVTTSELGISVRTAVVRGAQTMDKLDGQWEQFSDKFGLGAERSKQSGRPKPKVIPPLEPLDEKLAQAIVDKSDQVFVSTSGVSSKKLQESISTVRQLVKPSFQRSGVNVDYTSIDTAEQFNFECYVRYKAYADLLVDSNINFRQFKPKFEQQLGSDLLALLYPSYEPSKGDSKQIQLQSALQAIDQVSKIMQERGLVALTERSDIDMDDLNDWVRDLASIQFSLALDGDATLNAQVLLQEQGIRLIPSFVRFIAGVLLQEKGQQVTIEDYYMDTDYNSNPDLFQVKEVLLNVVLEST